MAKVTQKTREKILMRLAQGEKVQKLADHYGISAQAIYLWLNKTEKKKIHGKVKQPNTANGVELFEYQKITPDMQLRASSAPLYSAGLEKMRNIPAGECLFIPVQALPMRPLSFVQEARRLLAEDKRFKNTYFRSRMVKDENGKEVGVRIFREDQK